MDASTSVSRIVKAPRKAVYQAFVDPNALAKWLAPETMAGKVHHFDPRVGGEFLMSSTYQDPANSPGGKTTQDTDTFRGRFVELVPDQKIVWAINFESPDPGFAGEMRMVMTFTDAGDGTEVTILCENIPPGIKPQDNEEGTRQSLAKLARLLE